MSGPDIDARNAADEAAAEWLLAHDRSLTGEESEQFDAWLASSPVNEEAWNHAQRSWAEFDLEPDPLLTSMRESALAMHRPTWRSLQFQGAAMAASVLLCVGLLTWRAEFTVPDQSRPAAASTAMAAQRYQTGMKRADIVLRDGSRVTLDARSSISVALAAGRRDIALIEGQAFFRVAHDVRRPFVVAAGGRTVTATGTEFGVSLVMKHFTVVLEQGSVSVASGGRTAQLRPGQQFTAADGSGGRVSRVDVGDALAWRSGYVELHNVTIAEAVARMDRYARDPVIVGDAPAGALRVTGRFRTDDPLRFVQTLSELYPVRVERSEKGITTIVSAGHGGRQ